MYPTAETPAQIAARYGATVAPGLTVQRLPRGASSWPLPVWDGHALRYPDPEQGKRLGWRGGNSGGLGNPRTVAAALERRPKVAQLHAEGLSDSQIADALGARIDAIRTDRRHLGLSANPPHVAKREDRLDRLRSLFAAGHTPAQIAAILGRSENYIRRVAAQAGIALPPAPRRRDKAQQAVRRKLIPKGRAEDQAEARRKRDRARNALKRAAAKAAGHVSLKEARDARHAKVREAHAAGLSIPATVEATGLSHRRIWQDRKDMGLPPTEADLELRRESRVRTIERMNRRRRQRAARKEAPRQRYAVLAADVLTRAGAGATVESIAAAMGISPRRVAGALRRAGLTPDYDRSRAWQARERELRERVAQGQVGAEIAAAMGISLSTLYSYAHRKGVSLLEAGGRAPCNVGSVSPKVASRREKVAQLRAEGLTLDAMQAALQVSRATLSNDIAALGLAGSSPNTPSRRSLAAHRPDLAARALALRGEGLGLMEVARRMDLPHFTCRRLIAAAERGL